MRKRHLLAGVAAMALATVLAGGAHAAGPVAQLGHDADNLFQPIKHIGDRHRHRPRLAHESFHRAISPASRP